MVLGTGSGMTMHALAAPSTVHAVSDWSGTVADLFLRLIRMIVAPLVLATLAGGIAGMRHAGSYKTGPFETGPSEPDKADDRRAGAWASGGIGRIAALSMGWFLAASLVSLSLGLLSANLLHPGSGLGLPRPPEPAGSHAPFDAHAFIVHLVPTSLFDAMARNDIVQIVVFAALFGTAVSALPEAASGRLRTALSDLADAMLRLTGTVMRLAPVAVFAALLGTFARGGVAMAGGYALFVGGFYATMLVLWALMIGAGYMRLRRRVFVLVRMIAPQMLLAFATASSEAVFPQMVATLERFGVPPRLTGFVLPLGYAFNLDGAMLFQAFAALFIAQAYGIVLSFPQQAGMLLVLMATSKGTAGVPRAAIVALAAVLPAFGLPDAGLLLILGIDHLLDMGRTATSVLGNAIATATIGAGVSLNSDK